MSTPVTVVRYQRRRIPADPDSPMVYLLKQEPRSSKTYTIDTLAEEIETVGALSTEDVIHTMQAFVRAMRKVLISGNRVKVEGLGTFYITLSNKGVEIEEECTVRNIRKVNLRFRVDNTLRLVNDSIATTRNAPNNVVFELYTPKDEDTRSSGGGGGNSGDNGDDGDEGGLLG
ncbi:MAG: HU family DNA-binding protein [Bacteroides sp.]|nr:HU family DNA-binding protein [Bacteroides sp.]